MFKNIERVLKNMGFDVSFDMDCSCGDSCKCSPEDDSCGCQSDKSMFYGYEYSVGPDGKPMFREYGNVPSPLTGKALGQEPNRSKPDVIENDDGTGKIIVEAPGFEKEDFGISLSGDTLPLVIKITAKREERVYNESVKVDFNIKIDSIKAKYTNGVLEITFSKVTPNTLKIDVE